MGVGNNISAILCEVRADPLPGWQERGDTAVSTWFDGSMSVWVIAVRVDGCGVVACIVVVLVQKVTKENLKWDTLIASAIQ